MSRRPSWTDPETRRLLDFTQPVALLLAAVLHFVPDSDRPGQILATLRDALAPGSYLAISHACRDADPGVAAEYETAYNSRVAASSAFRTREQITDSSTASPSSIQVSSGSRNGGPTLPMTSPKTLPRSGQ